MRTRAAPIGRGAAGHSIAQRVTARTVRELCARAQGCGAYGIGAEGTCADGVVRRVKELQVGPAGAHRTVCESGLCRHADITAAVDGSAAFRLVCDASAACAIRVLAVHTSTPT